MHRSTHWKCITIKEGTVECFALNGWKDGCKNLNAASNPSVIDSNGSQIPIFTEQSIQCFGK